MAKSALLSVRIVADGKEAAKGFNDVARGVGSLEGNLKKTTSPMSKVTSLIGGIAKVAGGAVKAVGAVALGVAALAIKGGISKSLQIENATAKMKGLKHSTETVSAVMDDALSSVKGTAFGLGDAANIASTAMASGIKPGQEMRKYLTLVADAAATAQVPLGEMGQIMGKVTNSGKVTNEVLTQFGDRGVGALQMLAEHYGVTAAEMTAMVSKGQVDAATFSEVLNNKIGGAAKKSGDTTVGAFANMKSALANFGIVLGGAFFPLFKGVFNQIQFILEGLTERLKPVSDAFAVTFQAKAGPIIANFASNTLAVLDEVIGGFRAFGAAWKENNGDVTSSGFPGFMERVANAGRAVQGVFKQLDFSSFDSFTASLGTAGGSAGTALGSIGDSVQALLPAFQAFMAQLPKISGAVVKLGGMSLNVLTAGLSFLADHVDTIIRFMPLIVAGFVAWRVASAATAAGQARINALQVLAVPLTTANNILRLIAIRQENQLAVATGSRTLAMQTSILAMGREKVAMVANGAVMLAQKAALGVATAAQWAWNAAMSANPVMLIVLGIAALVAGVILAYNNIGWFKDFVDASFKAIQLAIGVVVVWFKNAWSVPVKAVGLYIKAWQIVIAVAFAAVRLAITKVVDWFKSAWNFAVKAVGLYIRAWQLVIGVVFAAVRALVTGVVNFFKSAWSGAVNIVAGHVQWFRTVFSNIVSGIRNIVSGVVSFFQNAWYGAINGAATFVYGFQSTISNIFANIRGYIDTVIGAVRDTLGGAFNTAASVAGGAMRSIIGAISGVIDWIRSAIDWIGSLFGKANSGGGGGGGATSYIASPVQGMDGPGGATGSMIRPARFAASSSSAAPTVTNINVSVTAGVGDPVAIGRELSKFLKTYERTMGITA